MRPVATVSLICLAFLAWSCRQRPMVTLDEPGWLSEKVEVVELANGELPHGRFPFRYESDVHGRLAKLRKQERLDEVVQGAASEFEQFVLLMDWTNRQWDLGMPNPYPPWDAFQILEEIRQGRTGGFCAQYAVVFAQACLSLGCQARYVDIIDLLQDGRRTHFTVEVWSNDYQKWVVMDPSYNIYFQRDGVPLSALDLHMAIRRQAWQDILLVKGPSSRGLKVTDLKTMVGDYKFFAVDLRNDHLSRSQHIWVRDGSLDWSDRYDYYAIWSTVPILTDPGYNQPKYSETIDDFYWSVNRTHMVLTTGMAPREISAQLTSYTPNFQTFMMKQGDAEWTRTAGMFTWRLQAGINTVEVKAVNVFGVEGAPVRARVNVHD